VESAPVASGVVVDAVPASWRDVCSLCYVG
jgi:hypothetical protein